MTRGPTISRPTLWSKADPLDPSCAPDPRLMPQGRAGCRESGGWAGNPVRTRRAEWAGGPPLVGSGGGGGHTAVPGPSWVWVPLGGGHWAEGGLEVLGSEGGREWMLLEVRRRGSRETLVQVSLSPTSVSVPPLSLFSVVETLGKDGKQGRSQGAGLEGAPTLELTSNFLLLTWRSLPAPLQGLNG